MNRFLRDNMHLELLHRADTKPLAEIFGPVVGEHAQQFSSLSPAPTCSEEGNEYSEPIKYTLTVLPPESISVLKSIYGIQYPEYKTSVYTLTISQVQHEKFPTSR